MARDAGFSNINIDLMSAIPEQTYADWEKNLRTVAGISPEHISAYSLIIEEGTPFGERKLKLPDEDTENMGFSRTRAPIMQKADGNAAIIRDTGRESIIWGWDLGRLHFWIICVFPILRI